MHRDNCGDALRLEATPKDKRLSHVFLVVGYGIVCGLAFPLMISSTFLRAMDLSHGAGRSFGFLFFTFYCIALFMGSAFGRFGRSGGGAGISAAAYAAVIVGNGFMMGMLLGIIEVNWLYAIASSGCIGFGLAFAELDWIERISFFKATGLPGSSVEIPLAFLLGSAFAATIFFLTGVAEISFALVLTVLGFVCSCICLCEKSATPRLEEASPGSFREFVRAVLYLSVFSFAFGAISRVTVVTGGLLLSESTMGIGGIIVAAVLSYLLLRFRGVLDVSSLYGILFPLVAVALILLPFVNHPVVQSIASLLVFTSYYLSGIFVRVIICSFKFPQDFSVRHYAGLALGPSALLILVGVLFGNAAVEHLGGLSGFALTALVSLFVLATNPIISSVIARRAYQSKPMKSDLGTESPEISFSEKYQLTSREIQVFSLIRQGRTRSYIAAELCLSPNTIKGYTHTLYQKCGVTSKQDLLDEYESFLRRYSS